MKMQTKPSILIGLYLVLSFIAHTEKAKSHAPRLTCPSSFDRPIRILNLKQLAGAGCEAFCGDSSPLQTYF